MLERPAEGARSGADSEPPAGPKIKALEEQCLLLPPIDSNSGSDILLETRELTVGQTTCSQPTADKIEIDYVCRLDSVCRLRESISGCRMDGRRGGLVATR